MVLDEGGIELLWRVHFGFFDPVEAGKDTDGDGTSDADEEKNWTDPKHMNEPRDNKSPEKRRQEVIDAMWTPPFTLYGKSVTPSEELAFEYAANAGTRTRIAMAEAAAHDRVKAWLKRTGKRPDDFRDGVIVDVQGEAPVILYDNGIISNTSANIMPLWPGQSVVSNVTGYGLINNTMTRQICGMWETYLPLSTHNELVGRVTYGDLPVAPAQSHATAVAGIIGATGTAGFTPNPGYSFNFVHADYKGVAYQCEIRAYNVGVQDGHYTELNALSSPPGTGENLLKRMRVSNHSYGPDQGWNGQDADGIRLWDGDVLQILGRPIPEDYQFGMYNEDARTADETAYSLSYHLLVRAAGNENEEGPLGEYFHIKPDNGNGSTIYGWVTSYIGTGAGKEEVYVHVGTNSYVKRSDVVRVYGNIDQDFKLDAQGNQILDVNGNPIPNLDFEDNDMDGDEIYNDQDGDIDGDNILNEQDYTPRGSVRGAVPNHAIHTDPLNVIANIPQDGWDGEGYSDSLPGGFTVCKNALCVGALGDNDTEIAYYSGVGPTDDGRIKPDVVARGGVAVAQENDPPSFPLLGAAGPDDYNYRDVGTSFAAPAVSGAVTLLSEWQEKLRSNKEPFRASTFKALICHTATNIPPPAAPQSPPGPNFTFGWGRINAAEAAQLIKANNNRRHIAEVFLPNASTVASVKLRALGAGTPIKLTISWIDPPGAIQPNLIDQPVSNALKHNINLKLIKTTAPNVDLHPWTPNLTTPHDPYPAATPETWRGQNNRDTVEQVSIAAPQANDEYEIRISSSTPLTAGTIPGQWVSVVMEGLFSPSTVEDGTILGATVATQSTYVVFTTVMGGYYRLQCQPYGGPWINIDAPAGEGLIRARSDLRTTWFEHIYGNTPVPLRIVKLSPNPFNVP